MFERMNIPEDVISTVDSSLILQYFFNFTIDRETFSERNLTMLQLRHLLRSALNSNHLSLNQHLPKIIAHA